MPKSKTNKLFCSRPFKWFEPYLYGKTWVCCPDWMNRSKKIGNILENSVEQLWNGKDAQEIRGSVFDGSFRYCNAYECPYLQTESGPVQRVDEVTDPELKEVIEKRLTVLPYGPRVINHCFDFSCNLSCPSCRTEVEIARGKQKDNILKIQDKLQQEALKDVHELFFSGFGDPFGSPYQREWLQSIQSEEAPNLKKIFLHTNGQLWTPAMWATLDKIQPFIKGAQISIDATCPQTYLLNRRGGSFKKLLENLEFIKTLHQDGPLEFVCISFVVQLNNFREMPDFVELGKRFDFDCVYFSHLTNWWRAYSEKEYLRRAIHLHNHPHHLEFLDLIREEIFDEPIVNLGNLSELRN